MKTLIKNWNACFNMVSSSGARNTAQALIFILSLPFSLKLFKWALGALDPIIYQLILLAFCCWLLLTTCAFLLWRLVAHQLLHISANHLFFNFKNLKPWEQYLLLTALFALLLLAAVGCLVAIC